MSWYRCWRPSNQTKHMPCCEIQDLAILALRTSSDLTTFLKLVVAAAIGVTTFLSWPLSPTFFSTGAYCNQVVIGFFRLVDLYDRASCHWSEWLLLQLVAGTVALRMLWPRQMVMFACPAVPLPLPNPLSPFPFSPHLTSCMLESWLTWISAGKPWGR